MKKILVCSLALLAAGLMAACKDSSKNDKDGEIYSSFSSGGTGGGIDTSGTSSTIRCTARTSMRRSQTAFPPGRSAFFMPAGGPGLSGTTTMDCLVPPRWTVRCRHDGPTGPPAGEAPGLRAPLPLPGGGMCLLRRFSGRAGGREKKEKFLKKHHFVLDINGEPC